MTPRVLVVDDQEDMRWVLSNLLEKEGLAVTTACDGLEALELLAKEEPHIVLLDVRMPGLDGMACLERLRPTHPMVPVIVLTAYGDIRSAVHAMRLGADDYLTKPFDNDAVLFAVRRALERAALSHEVQGLRAQLESAAGLGGVMGTSREIQGVFLQVHRVARTDFTVILQGETGTGKELLARAIHQQSDRRDRPFLAVDCGAIPESLIEGQLFGHERGAFTGAEARREGDFELASGGTLFLDEVGNLPLGTQAKLLRVLQERQLRRLGGKQFIRVDARILAATNADLQAELRRGRFRQDLFHRLNEFTISIPPLRERREDILFLAKVFLDEARMELKRPLRGISEQAAKLLQVHSWPGNVRELRNVIRRAALLCADTIEPENLLPLDSGAAVPAAPDSLHESPGADLPLKEIRRKALAQVERQAIQQTLDESRGNRSQTARLLGIDQKTLRAKIRALGIGAREFAPQGGRRLPSPTSLPPEVPSRAK